MAYEFSSGFIWSVLLKEFLVLFLFSWKVQLCPEDYIIEYCRIPRDILSYGCFSARQVPKSNMVITEKQWGCALKWTWNSEFREYQQRFIGKMGVFCRWFFTVCDPTPVMLSSKHRRSHQPIWKPWSWLLWAEFPFQKCVIPMFLEQTEKVVFTFRHNSVCARQMKNLDFLRIPGSAWR